MQAEDFPAQLRLMRDKLASIMAAAIYKDCICVQEGLLDLIDAVTTRPDYSQPDLDDYGHHPVLWPRLIAQHYLDPSLPSKCSPATYCTGSHTHVDQQPLSGLEAGRTLQSGIRALWILHSSSHEHSNAWVNAELYTCSRASEYVGQHSCQDA